MTYVPCGKSGLKLPMVSLGFWHNFGDTASMANMKAMCFTAFDAGITHFDLANNYGPEAGSAEINAGRILRENFLPYRDELIISTKAGYDMWPGPYGDWGSRKYLLASLDQSLKRLGLEYVDIFYHHRMDPETPLEETMGALAWAVNSGKALYAGLSNYNGETLEKACAILADLKVPFIINQNRYNIFDRTIEQNGLKEASATCTANHSSIDKVTARIEYLFNAGICTPRVKLFEKLPMAVHKFCKLVNIALFEFEFHKHGYTLDFMDNADAVGV